MFPKKTNTIASIGATVVLLLSLTACGSTVNTPTPTPNKAPETATSSPAVPAKSPESVTPKKTVTPTKAPTTDTPIVTAGTALAALQALPIKPLDHTNDYKRTKFGTAWADVDKNGCDTRNDILARDLTSIAKSGNCTVQTGTFADPYTGLTINFDKSKGGGGGVDIDHVVALSNAWSTGAASWDDATRLKYANDPMVLLSSDSGENRGKGDKDAANYLPPNVGFQCEYVARQITVRKSYNMWVTSAEKQAMEKVLSTCPQEPLLTGNPKASKGQGSSTVASSPVAVPAVPAPVTKAAPVAEQPAANGQDPKFASCKAAKEAGFGPYDKSQVEYGWYRDANNNGTVCE